MLLAYGPHIPERARILEIGAGAGWQAAELSNSGFLVEAIDVASSIYYQERVYDVEIYDGRHIPFLDQYFDIVFTSHVLDEVEHVEQVMSEMARVLKPEGVAIHVLPTASWRVWTNIAHYPALSKALWRRIAGSQPLMYSRPDCHHHKHSNKIRSNGASKSLFQSIWSNIMPSGLGVRGNSFSQIYSFSGTGWEKFFMSFGWETIRMTNGLFYTGYSILGPRVTIGQRMLLSKIFGSSAHILMTKPSIKVRIS